MEEEIDLREYVRVLLRWWKWIVGVTAVAAAVALVVGLLLPPAYEATALVVVTKPRYTMQFDPRIETSAEAQPPYKAYPALAMSDAVLEALRAQVDLPKVKTLADLREMVSAKLGDDPSVVQLTVRTESAQDASRIADAWATIFVARANEVYGSASEEQVRFFEGQMEQARSLLDKAEQALAEFQKRNEAGVLEQQRAAAANALSADLAEKTRLEQVTRRARALQESLSSQTATARAPVADALTALLIEAQAFGVRDDSQLQLQLSEGLAASAESVGDLSASLERLITTLNEQGAKLDAHIASLQPQILALQGKIREINAEGDRLTRERDVARDTYTSLAHKVDETRIAAQDTSREIQLVSKPAVPDKPAAAHRLTTVAIAAAAALMLAVFGVFAVEWWRGEAPRPAALPAEDEKGACVKVA